MGRKRRPFVPVVVFSETQHGIWAKSRNIGTQHSFFLIKLFDHFLPIGQFSDKNIFWSIYFWSIFSPTQMEHLHVICTFGNLVTAEAIRKYISPVFFHLDGSKFHFFACGARITLLWTTFILPVQHNSSPQYLHRLCIQRLSQQWLSEPLFYTKTKSPMFKWWRFSSLFPSNSHHKVQNFLGAAAPTPRL